MAWLLVTIRIGESVFALAVIGQRDGNVFNDFCDDLAKHVGSLVVVLC